jgi:hypothetical protein
MRDWSAQRQHRRWVKYSCLMVTGDSVLLPGDLDTGQEKEEAKETKEPGLFRSGQS